MINMTVCMWVTVVGHIGRKYLGNCKILFPPMGSILAVMLVWRLTGKIIRTVLCHVVIRIRM